MKNLFLFATAAAVLCSCSNQPKYIIDGDIAGLEGTVYLYQGDSLIDSAAVKAGKFQFRGNAQTPGVHYLLDSREGPRRLSPCSSSSNRATSRSRATPRIHRFAIPPARRPTTPATPIRQPAVP